jgi:Flp pilus assembly CpaE family ATPase
VHELREDPLPAAPPAQGKRRGRCIVVTSGKGGVGKTTTTANVGVALAATGARVVLVDADVGLRNLDIVLGLEARVRHHVLDVLEGNAELDDALVSDKRVPTLKLLAASQTREKDDVDTNGVSKRWIDRLREKFRLRADRLPGGHRDGLPERDRRGRRGDHRLHAGSERGARRRPRRRAARRAREDRR